MKPCSAPSQPHCTLPCTPSARMHRAVASLLGLSAALAAGQALAVPVFELTGHSAYVALNNINSGIGVAPTRIDAGTVTSNSLVPGEVSLVGSGSDFEAASVFTSELHASWSIGQSFALNQVGDDMVLDAAGALLLEAQAVNCILDQCTTTNTVGYTSENFQIFQFQLSEAASYSAQGGSARDQIVYLDIWNSSTQVWDNYGGWNEFLTYGGSSFINAQAITPWAMTGSLDAGLYRLSNGPYAYGNPTYPYTSWAYQITLANTELAPVPEPAALLLMGLGVAGLLVRQRLAR
jgi:hypothetical protein